MQPHDIVYFEDKKFGCNRFWEIEGVYLGALGQESLVGLKSLTDRPGNTGMSNVHPIVFVPEPILRSLAIYTPDIR